MKNNTWIKNWINRNDLKIEKDYKNWTVFFFWAEINTLYKISTI